MKQDRSTNRDLLVATLSHSTPRELLEVATKLQSRSSDHAAVLHDSLYSAAVRARARPVASTIRRKRMPVMARTSSLKARWRARSG